MSSGPQVELLQVQIINQLHGTNRKRHWNASKPGKTHACRIRIFAVHMKEESVDHICFHYTAKDWCRAYWADLLIINADLSLPCAHRYKFPGFNL